MTRNQLNLPYSGKSEAREAWELILAEIRNVVDRMTLKEAAFLLDVKPSYLAHALSERDRHYIRAEWLLPLLMRSKDLGLARALVGPAGLDVEAKPELSAEEKLERLERTLSETLGPDIRRSIYDKAWRRE